MSEVKHTPTPWRVEENTDLIWGDCNPDDTTTYGMGYPVVSGFASFGQWAAGRPDFNEKEANAAFIVTAVNAYDKHVALIETLTKALKTLAKDVRDSPEWQRHLDALGLADDAIDAAKEISA